MAKRKEYFVKLTESVLSSHAFRDLKPTARALLLEFLRIYRPNRNGRLTIDTAKAQGLINSSEKVAARAFYELSEHGLIKLMKNHSWTKKIAREWAITFHPMNEHEPTNDYLKWSKGENMHPELVRPKWLRKKNRP